MHNIQYKNTVKMMDGKYTTDKNDKNVKMVVIILMID